MFTGIGGVTSFDSVGETDGSVNQTWINAPLSRSLFQMGRPDNFGHADPGTLIKSGSSKREVCSAGLVGVDWAGATEAGISGEGETFEGGAMVVGATGMELEGVGRAVSTKCGLTIAGELF